MNMAWKGLMVVLAAIVVISNGQYTHRKKVDISLKAKKLPQDCGQPEYFGTSIFGGTDVELGEYPWMASVGYTNSSGSLFWMCGASLITDQYLVTAAHCVNPAELEYPVSVVVLGHVKLNVTMDNKASPDNLKIDKILIHPQYDLYNHVNDIALLKLKTKVQFTRFKKPICLPLSKDFYQWSYEGSYSVVIGWGLTENGPTTDLKKVSVEIKNAESCKRNYTRQTPWLQMLTETVICASSPEKDSCAGDSGGPLMMMGSHTGNPRLYLLGVVSIGPQRCADKKLPGIYTKVSYFVDWILDSLEL